MPLMRESFLSAPCLGIYDHLYAAGKTCSQGVYAGYVVLIEDELKTL